MKKPAGFTLIELMVVIVILAILSALLAPRIPLFLNRAKEGKTKGNLATLRSTINVYYSDNDGIYPIDNLDIMVPKYIKQVPDCILPPNHNTSNTVTNSTIIGNTDEGNWQYDNDNNDVGWGNVWIECTHTDSSGVIWTSF